jgi:hypothetical protein
MRLVSLRSVRRLLSAAMLPLGAAFVGALGCMPTAPGALGAQLQSRASYDLGCAPFALGIYPLDARTRLVTGCGRRLVYVEDCESIRGEATCTWKLDTPSFAQTQWPQWVTGPAPTTVVMMSPAASGRVVATNLFDGGAASAAAAECAPPPPTKGPSSASPPPPPPSAGPTPPPPSARGQAGGREIPVDLFDSRK